VQAFSSSASCTRCSQAMGQRSFEEPQPSFRKSCIQIYKVALFLLKVRDGGICTPKATWASKNLFHAKLIVLGCLPRCIPHRSQVILCRVYYFRHIPILSLKRNLFVIRLVPRLRLDLSLRHAIHWLGQKLNTVCKNLCTLAVVAFLVLIFASANLAFNRNL